MTFITTTQLRTRSKELVKALEEGRSVELIHRSKIVGRIKPVQTVSPLTKEGIKMIKEAAEKLNLPKLSYEEREKRYRKYMRDKYGEGIS